MRGDCMEEVVVEDMANAKGDATRSSHGHWQW